MGRVDGAPPRANLPTVHPEAILDTVCAQGLTDPADPRWAAMLRRLFPRPEDASAFVQWATDHPKWRFNVADVADRICGKPVEAAVAILCDIATERLDERAD